MRGVLLEPFDCINMPSLCFCMGNFAPKIAWCTPALEFKPSEIEAPTYGLLSKPYRYRQVVYSLIYYDTYDFSKIEPLPNDKHFVK